MISPKTQMYSEGQSSTDAEESFKQKFATMAYDNFAQKHPDLAGSITGFRVEKVDLYNDIGVGVVQLVFRGTEVQVPTVVSGGKLFPSSVMYLVEKKRFVPFDKKWITIAQTDIPISVGTPREMPDSVNTDRDLRHIMQPPQTGRYSFASCRPQESLLYFLSEAPNNIKLAFLDYMKNSDKIATYVVRKYGYEKLASVLAANDSALVSKLASETICEQVGIYDDTTPHNILRVVFKTAAPRALASIYEQGYVIADERNQHLTKTAVFKENLVRLTTIGPPGAYTVYKADGSVTEAFITDKVIDLAQPSTKMRKALPGFSSDDDIYSVYANNDLRNLRSEIRQGKILIYTVEGDYYTSSQGIPRQFSVGVIHNERPVIEELFSKATPDTKMGLGFYVLLQGGQYSTTLPVNVKRITISDGVERIAAEIPGTNKVLTITRGGPYPAHDIEIFNTASDRADVIIPKTFFFVSIKEVKPLSALVGRASAIFRMLENKTLGAGMCEVHVSKDSIGELHLDGKRVTKSAAVAKLIGEHDLSYISTRNVMRRVERMYKHSSFDFYVGSNYHLCKTAAEHVPLDGAGQELVPQEQDPNAPQGDPAAQDPNAPQGDPAAEQDAYNQAVAMQEQQQAPGPLDVAMQDIITIIQAQREEIQRSFADELRILDAREEAVNLLQGRAEALAQGAPPTDYASIREFAKQKDLWGPTTAPEISADTVEGAVDSEQQMGVEGEDPNAVDPNDPNAEVDPNAVDPNAAVDPNDPNAVDPNDPNAAPEQQGMPEGSFEATAIASLMNDTNIDNFGSDYLPQIQDTIDKLSRTLLELYMKAPYFRKQMGEVEFDSQVNRLNKQIKDLGDITASMYQQSLVLPGETV